MSNQAEPKDDAGYSKDNANSSDDMNIAQMAENGQEEHKAEVEDAGCDTHTFDKALLTTDEALG